MRYLSSVQPPVGLPASGPLVSVTAGKGRLAHHLLAKIGHGFSANLFHIIRRNGFGVGRWLNGAGGNGFGRYTGGFVGLIIGFDLQHNAFFGGQCCNGRVGKGQIGSVPNGVGFGFTRRGSRPTLPISHPLPPDAGRCRCFVAEVTGYFFGLVGRLPVFGAGHGALGSIRGTDRIIFDRHDVDALPVGQVQKCCLLKRGRQPGFAGRAASFGSVTAHCPAYHHVLGPVTLFFRHRTRKYELLRERHHVGQPFGGVGRTGASGPYFLSVNNHPHLGTVDLAHAFVRNFARGRGLRQRQGAGKKPGEYE